MWAQLINAAIGIWLMAAPAVLGYGGTAATIDRVIGPCIAALGVVAVGECTRGVRWWLLPFAAWLIVAPWALQIGPPIYSQNSLACGVGVACFALLRGRVKGQFGGGWSTLLRKGGADPGQMQET